jgi:hypothetical protein
MRIGTTLQVLLLVTCILSPSVQAQLSGSGKRSVSSLRALSEDSSTSRIIEQDRVVGEKPKDPDACRKVFGRAQDAVASGNIAALSEMFGSQVVLNIRNGESGLYSTNQAFYVLERYFKTRRPVSFEFTSFNESETSPYATGSAAVNFKGSRELVQIYVALGYSGDQWVITQINIY